MPTMLPIAAHASLAEVADDLRQRLMQVPPGEQDELADWVEQLLVDHPEKCALVLAPGAQIDGDLVLDEGELSGDGQPVAALVVWGDLKISGRLLDENEDGGPFLIVGGDLKVEDIAKAAAPVIVLGNIESSGLILCDGDNGILHAGGVMRCRGLVDNDHDVYAGRGIEGPVASEEFGNLRDLLVPEVFESPDDPEDEWPDGDLLRSRLMAGEPLFKG